MVRELSLEKVKNMNYLPSKGGVSENYNPQMIMNINKLDYHKYCNITFDAYVQALN